MVVTPQGETLQKRGWGIPQQGLPSETLQGNALQKKDFFFNEEGNK